MQITKYRAMLDENKHNILVKEEVSNYQSSAMNRPELVAKMLNEVFELNRQAEEYLYMISVDVKLKPLGVFEVFHGSVNSCFALPREIFIRALLSGAVEIYLAHNHPSGDCYPSTHDNAVTKRIEEAGNLLGIKVVDHIIVGDCDYYSYREHHLLNY